MLGTPFRTELLLAVASQTPFPKRQKAVPILEPMPKNQDDGTSSPFGPTNFPRTKGFPPCY